MKAKNDYTQRMTNKLNDPKAAPKTYWSILNRFLYNEKIPAIPPLLVNGKFVSNSCTKANLFNDFLLKYVHNKHWKYNATICIQNQYLN